MEDVEKKEEAEDTQDDVQADDTQGDDTSDDQQATDDQKDGDDNYHKNEVAKLTKQLGQAEHNIEEERRKRIEAEKGNGGKSNDDIEAIKRELSEENKREIEAFKLDQVSDTLEDILSEVTSSEAEKEHVRLVYENKINKSGFSKAAIRADIEDAKIIANKNKDKTTKDEKNMIDDSQKTRTGGYAAGQDETEERPNELSGEAKKLADAFGVDPKTMQTGYQRKT